MPNGLKVIFLDIDGVLNTFNHLKNQNRLTGKVSKKDWCPTACRHVVLLCEYYKAKIVLISSWRHEYSMTQIREFFSSNDISPEHLMDRTSSTAPQTDGQNYCRGHEIKHWLNEVDKDIGAYVIIDDEAKMLEEQEPYLVRTDKNAGFASKEAVTQASNILDQAF